MRARSYQVAVVTVENGERVPHSGYIRLTEKNTLSGMSDEFAIREATQSSFPAAIEYLPLRIPNRQYDKVMREKALNALTTTLMDSFLAAHEMGAIENTNWVPQEALTAN